VKKIKNILGFIPARSGSKGISRKNVRFVDGKPLIFYTINEALKSKFLSRVVVSTDSRIIAALAAKYGAKVIKRPKELARDDTPTSPVILHALQELEKEGYKPDLIVILQPTSPFRKSYHIDEAVELFLKSDCDFVVSVCEAKITPFWCFTAEKNYLKPLLKHNLSGKRRQDLPRTYVLNGAIFIYTPDKLFKNNLNYFNGKTLPYFMKPEESIDIDDELDLILARELMRKEIYEESKSFR